MSQLLQGLEESSKLLLNTINELLPSAGTGRKGCVELYQAMRYSALSGGKRLRPFLVLSSANLFGVGKNSALHAAAAIELIHTYSLIHDDLPAIDNDDTRRGQPSCHVAFDEATAILAGDALLSFAFEILSDPVTHPDPGVRCELVHGVSMAIGPRGMVAGQMMDILSEKAPLNMEEVTHMQRMKTGALFTISCEAGAILGKAPMPLRNGLRAYAQAIGLAFQITDDLLDVAIDLEDDSDKPQRINKSAKKATFVSVTGIERAKQQAEMLSEQAIMHLEPFDKRADHLRDLARYIVERKQ